ncbi:MAG: WbqC family protein [Lachnospiraceae bacterium]|nr:WbqC family protein [Lachnospiraceae bacterium]
MEIMKYLALHQTYFFPYIGYFSLIKNVDIFVFADNLQYMRRSWVNRNRVLTNLGVPQYISVPVVHHPQKTPANQVQIDYSRNWQQEILNMLNNYRKIAPHYNDVMDMIDELFSKHYDNIADLGIQSVLLAMNRLGIDTECHCLSKLNPVLKDEMEPDDWGICISKHFDADVYRNAPGGKSFYRPERYHEAGLEIEFLQNRLHPYDQKTTEFVPGLSILDVMMFNSPEEIAPMLDDFDLI